MTKKNKQAFSTDKATPMNKSKKKKAPPPSKSTNSKPKSNKAAIENIESTKSGKGWKLVNLNSTSNQSLIISDQNLYYDLNDWNADVFSYREEVKKYPVQTDIENIFGSNNFEELKDVKEDLFQVLNDIKTKRGAIITQMIEQNSKFSFEMLQQVLSHKINEEVLFCMFDAPIFGKLISSAYKKTWNGIYLEVGYEFFRWKSNQVALSKSMIKIPLNDESKTLKEWGLEFTLSSETKKELLERGKKIFFLNQKCDYINIVGSMEIKVGWFSRTIPATGRALVDTAGYELFQPDLSRDDNYSFQDRELMKPETLTEANLMMLNRTLTVFSFVAKKWGKIDVDQISEIKFREDAFEKLVMDEDEKKLIHSLVKNIDTSIVSDIIDNKGGGCILLLHGKPGLGKTLTAEAVAEVLKRPLYSVSVGELGTDPDSLESKLKTVLQTAERWNAVLLLDEADVFLESRKEGDVNRNAMVGIFLRLLEYYSGVLILTTNRIKEMDQAFFSRISLALKYKPLSFETRKQVLKNLLETNGVSLPDEDMGVIAQSNTNGRQIKNAIRIARFIAKDEQRNIHKEDILKVLNKLIDFETEFEAERKKFQ